MGVSVKNIVFVVSSCLLQLIHLAVSGPLTLDGPSSEVANNSLVEFDSVAARGCRYKSLFYSSGEEVSTDEPCLACQCKGTVVVCKLRICPEIPVPPPPGCIVVHKAKSCCSQLICHGNGQEPKKISREQRFPTSVSNETVLASVSNESKDSGYCVLDGTVYAEGSAMRSSTLCQYCFCIRGEMKCSQPQCVIPLNGCKPRFRSWACCPTHYECGQSNETAILKTIPSSTQVPQFLKGCLVNGQFVPEGEPVLPLQLTGAGNSTGSTNVCQTCFCMGGVVHCQPLECDQPIDGCMPIKEDGHCCPDRYDCSGAKTQDVLESTTTARTVLSSSSLFSSTPSSSSLSSEVTSNEMATENVQSTTEVTTLKPEVMESEETLVMTTSTSTSRSNEEFNEEYTTVRLDIDDSFERIATAMVGSSEESSSMLPPQILAKRVGGINMGGFRNRSDLGSREERRSKDADELALRQSTEDDERDELMYPVFDTTMSNAIEDLGATTLFDDPFTPTTDSEMESQGSVETDTTPGETWRLENVTESYVTYLNDDTTLSVQSANLIDDKIERNDIEGTPSNSDGIETETPTTTTTTTTTTQNPASISSTEGFTTTTEDPNPETVSTTDPSSPQTSSTPTASTTTPAQESVTDLSSTTTGYLEFIPFVEEDALLNDTIINLDDENLESIVKAINISSDDSLPSADPDVLREPILSLLKPLELKFMNGSEESLVAIEGSRETDPALEDALPILVEKDVIEPQTFQEPQNFENNITAPVPVSSSLYNNGYYPHGDIIKDDSPPGELMISEGEITPKEAEKVEDDEDEMGQSREDALFKLNLDKMNANNEIALMEANQMSSTSPIPDSPQGSQYETMDYSEQPLKPIGSDDEFITHSTSTTVRPSVDPISESNPARTYSKFALQDSPFYRYDQQGLPSVPMDANGYMQNVPQQPPQQYHHRYYNEPEEIPQSRIQNPYNFYTHTGPSGTGNTNAQGQSIGMLPPLYKNTNFFYDDSSAPLDSYEEYEYANPPSSNILSSSSPRPAMFSSSSSTTTSTTTSRTVPPIQFLGERVRLPSYNQQRATSTPKYKYALKSTFTKKLTTERSTTPVTEYLNPMHPFPFNLPTNQDNLYNLGIKLSGCNVVGKMYSVGEIIEELSSDCLRCMCSDIGVHCAELRCKK